jgi:hypothetical protein
MYPSNPTDRSCVQLIERLMPRVKKCHSLRRWGLDVSWTRPCSWLQCPRPDESASNPVPRLPLRSIHPAHRGKLRATWYTDRLLRHPIWFSAAPKSIDEANWWKSGSGGRRRSSRARRDPPDSSISPSLPVAAGKPPLIPESTTPCADPGPALARCLPNRARLVSASVGARNSVPDIGRRLEMFREGAGVVPAHPILFCEGGTISQCRSSFTRAVV